MRSFTRIKLLQYDEITLSFTDISKPLPDRESLTSQICLLTLFAKIKFSRKFSNLQYRIVQLSLYSCNSVSSLTVVTNWDHGK